MAVPEATAGQRVCPSGGQMAVTQTVNAQQPTAHTANTTRATEPIQDQCFASKFFSADFASLAFLVGSLR
jgi:hypothetical protein